MFEFRISHGGRKRVAPECSELFGEGGVRSILFQDSVHGLYTMDEEEQITYQLNTRCSSPVGNFPSSNGFNQWNPPTLTNARMRKGLSVRGV
jgi:hypothetical protein